MRPRRKLFGLDYIRETMNCYERAVADGKQAPRIDPGELTWAHDVLSDYFEATAAHSTIDPLRNRFQRLPRPTNGGFKRYVPFRRDLTNPPPITIDSFLELAQLRRSVRWFLDKPVPREMIDQAIEVALQSPSACNRQPFVFRVFDDREFVKKVAKIPMGTAGYEHNIPVFVVIVGQQRHFFDERDRHLIYIDSSLAAMGFVYALEAQGLSSCCINWPDIEDREAQMAELLGLESDERPILCVAVGFPDPDGLVAYSQKKPIDQLRRYNFE